MGAVARFAQILAVLFLLFIGLWVAFYLFLFISVVVLGVVAYIYVRRWLISQGIINHPEAPHMREGGAGSQNTRQPDVIEGEFTEVGEAPEPRNDDDESSPKS
tara:strand:- start:555 stop:863 length:309 start_codon:yes stop_codon:yes gene_type:complete